jgi:outer membrane protein
MPLTKRSRLPHPRALVTPLVLALGLAGLQQAAQADDLLQLYTAARAYDATYLSAKAQAESAQYKAAQANALRLPVVGLTASATREQSRLPAPASGTFSENSTTAGLQATQPLFNQANSATISQAERQLQMSQETLRLAEQDLIVRVAQAYFDVLAAQDALTNAQASKTAISEQLASAKRNFEVGTATITDTREAQARFDLANAQVLAAENNLRTKQVALDQIVGRSAVKPNGLAAPVGLVDLAPGEADSWVKTAETENPNVHLAQLRLDVAELETKKARAGNLPTVDLVGGVNTTHASGQLAALSGAPGTTSGASIGVQLNLPLFAGFSVQNRIKETLVLEDSARDDLQAARRQVEQGTRTAYLGVQSGEAQVKALEAAEASSKLALEATQLGYKVGVRVNLDVLNAESQLYQTQTQLAQARYDVLMGTLRLHQAVGDLGPDNVARVNQLLAK